jgi:hypothetical protein
VARRVVDAEADAGKLETLTVVKVVQVVGLREVVAELVEQGGRLWGHTGRRVGEEVAITRVDPGRGVVRAADRYDAEDMVDVTVGGENRDGPEPVFSDDLCDRVNRAHPGIDNHTLGTGGGR